ncbi:hypothetical protein LTR82_011398 [Friedmanniomyces endolithicus]|uniref:Uncharacterized protein n=1 Tax=Friedmanniomyces endolithicus TaxID=329885 RepID=A0AAN6J668_9PEZI|nr:hypothetical protein LTR82_011398 [Friedmanniomyces endolithicus]
MTRDPTAPLSTGASSVGDQIAFHSWKSGCDDEDASSQPSRSSAVLSLDELHPVSFVGSVAAPMSTEFLGRFLDFETALSRVDLSAI